MFMAFQVKYLPFSQGQPTGSAWLPLLGVFLVLQGGFWGPMIQIGVSFQTEVPGINLGKGEAPAASGSSA